MTGTIKLIRILLLIVIQHGGDDVSCKRSIAVLGENKVPTLGCEEKNVVVTCTPAVQTCCNRYFTLLSGLLAQRHRTTVFS